ncbi:MAG: radical SAM protein [Deltaproteobacteria bacterium]|nr:radical SAM protein [Deltaproteobacteria bacterium]
MNRTRITYPWQENHWLDYITRFIFTPYNSARKLGNLVLVLLQNMIKPKKAWAKPIKLIVEPFNGCNLHCPLCPTGRMVTDRKVSELSFGLFKQAVDPLSPYLYEVYLYNWGEPLLNPELFEFVKYCSQRRIKTIVSSNLTLFEPRMMDQLLASGLDTLIISLDGISSRTYLQYRRGGDFGKVMANMKGILKERGNRKSGRPKVVWQFIVFPFNEQEVAGAARLAREAGVDEIRFISSFSNMEEMVYKDDTQKQSQLNDFLPADPRYHLFRAATGKKAEIKPQCNYLWGQISLRTDGGIAPCCGSYYRRDDFGSLADDCILDIWNNDKYREARRAVKSGGIYRSSTICDACLKNNQW